MGAETEEKYDDFEDPHMDMEQFRDPEPEEEELERDDDDDGKNDAEHYVFQNLNTMKCYELTFDYMHENHADHRSLTNVYKRSRFPGKDPLEKIHLFGFDPVIWKASKQKRWEAIAGIQLEELKKMGIDAALKSFPVYPDKIPMIFPLRKISDDRVTILYSDMPREAPEYYMTMMRDRLQFRSDDTEPLWKPTDCVRVISDDVIEPSYRKVFREEAVFQKKNVVLEFELSILKLPPLVRHRFLGLVGRAYTEKTDTVRFVGSLYGTKKENRVYLRNLMKELLQESFLALPQFVSLHETDRVVSFLPPPLKVPPVSLGEDKDFVLFRFTPPPL